MPGVNWPTFSSASWPSTAVSVRYPHADMRSDMPERSLSSSSTMRTFSCVIHQLYEWVGSQIHCRTSVARNCEFLSLDANLLPIVTFSAPPCPKVPNCLLSSGYSRAEGCITFQTEPALTRSSFNDFAD